jgi:hypothetical protein
LKLSRRLAKAGGQVERFTTKVLRIGGRIFLLLVGITLVAAGFLLGLITAINLGFGVLAGCGGHVPRITYWNHAGGRRLLARAHHGN